MNHKDRGRVRGAFRRAGFTLVEILAAMTLAVLVMLGVAQVFKISSDAVSEAEGLSGGYQLLRGLSTALERDLRCFTNEGYLAVVGPNSVIGGNVYDIPATLTFRSPTPYLSSTTSAPRYRFDTLAFTAVGCFEDMEGVLEESPTLGCGAEIVYTFAGRKDGVGGTFLPYLPISDGDDDPRTMMLVRKVYPVKGTLSPAAYSGVGVRLSDAASKADGSMAAMSTDRWNDGTSSYYRVVSAPAAMAVNVASYQPRITTYPNATTGAYDESVNLVVCERISEFFVEVLVRNPTTGGETWWRAGSTPTLQNSTASGRAAGLWCGNLKLASTKDTTFRDTFMPKMIRVTAVVHPPNDNKKLSQETYAGEMPDDATHQKWKYRGMVFRQVFSLNGRLSAR